MLDEFISAFRAGDLDLAFPFRYPNRHTAFAAGEKGMGLPLFPPLSELLRITLDPVKNLQIFQQYRLNIWELAQAI